MLFNDHKPSNLKRFIVAALVGGIVLGGVTGGVTGAFVASSVSGRALSLDQIFKVPQLAKNDRTVEPEDGKNVPPGEKPAPAKPASEDLSLSGMVKKVSPAVVSIIITKEVAQNPIGNFFDMGPFSFDFGNGSGNESGGATQKQQVGGGSGFIISSDGLVVSNRHVVEDANATYTVQLADGTKHDAKVLARDTSIDLALLKIEGKDFPTVELGDSDALELGQSVVAIGNALGEFSNSVTRGIVSGLNRKITAGGVMSGSEVIDQAIQTDAAINPGNSGGPLLTLDGKVIGVNTAVSQQGQSVGFAIPINVAKQSIESVKKFGRIIRPYVGVRYVLIDESMAKQNQLPVDYGALISRGTQPGQVAVIPGSPADKAGLVENDIILEADGMKIDSEHTLTSVIVKKKVGDTVKLKIYHKGENKTVTVTLAEMPKS